LVFVLLQHKQNYTHTSLEATTESTILKISYSTYLLKHLLFTKVCASFPSSFHGYGIKVTKR
ncbi:MAG: hypothetical protein AABY49_06335, partial [Planctomycetota bacterium]